VGAIHAALLLLGLNDAGPGTEVSDYRTDGGRWDSQDEAGCPYWGLFVVFLIYFSIAQQPLVGPYWGLFVVFLIYFSIAQQPPVGSYWGLSLFYSFIFP
jgi:hypothetical protein